MNGDIEWLARKVENLKVREKVQEIRDKIGEDNLYKIHLWAPLKLIALMYWLDVYTKIISKRYSSRWYFDLLAATGADLIEETLDIVLGSPLLSYIIPQNPFTHHFFVELDKDRASVLDNVLKIFHCSEYEIYHGSCNQEINRIPFGEIDHYFCLIDCEGLDLEWNTLEMLLKYPGDILLTFQTSSMNRVFSRGRKSMSSPALDKFCGGGWWIGCLNISDLFNGYVKRVKSSANKLRGYVNFVDYVPVRGLGGRFKYDVLLICRRGEYVKAWSYLKGRLSRVEDKDVDLALDICRGEIRRLPEFFQGRQPRQAKLDNFTGHLLI